MCIHVGGNIYPLYCICWSSTGGPAACEILPGSKAWILHSCGKNGPETWPLHLDQAFATYILEGIVKGFRIGVDMPTMCVSRQPPTGCWRHGRQASSRPLYLDKEVALGELLAQSVLRQLQLTRNSACSGLFRSQFSPESGGLLVGISSKGGYSVNEGIKPCKAFSTCGWTVCLSA